MSRNQVAPLPPLRSFRRPMIAMLLPLHRFLFVALAFALTSCATTSKHQFAAPAAGSQTRIGQLMFRNAQTNMIGEVVVRFAKSGDFELTFSKGPVTMLTLRQDASFAEARGAMAGPGWSGPVERAPHQLKG